MSKMKKVFKSKKSLNKATKRKEELVKPYNMRSDMDKDETNDFLALHETKVKPPPKLTKHETIFN